MDTLDTIPDAPVREAASASRFCVLAIQNLCNHLAYTESFHRHHPEYPPSAFDGICDVGEDCVKRLAQRCAALRSAIAPIRYDLCRALEYQKRIDGKICTSVHDGILEKGEDLTERAMVLAGWCGVVDKRSPSLAYPAEQAPIKREWLMISKALGAEEFSLSVQAFAEDSLKMIINEAVAAAEKRAASGSPPSQATHKKAPPLDDWEFETGLFRFRGRSFDLTSVPLAMLQIMVTSRLQETFPEDALRPALRDDLAGRDTVRSHVKTLRAVLRDVAQAMPDATNEMKEDPIPFKSGAWRFLLPR